MTYQIVTRPIQAKQRGRKKSMLPDEVAVAVRQAVTNRDVEALIGVDDVAAGKNLLGVIKARVRDGSFGAALSVRGAVTESSTGKTVVVFSVLDYKPHSKPHVRKPKAVESAPETVDDAPQEAAPKAVSKPRRPRRQTAQAS